MLNSATIANKEKIRFFLQKQVSSPNILAQQDVTIVPVKDMIIVKDIPAPTRSAKEAATIPVPDVTVREKENLKSTEAIPAAYAMVRVNKSAPPAMVQERDSSLDLF